MNNTDAQELQRFRQQRAKQMFNQRRMHAVNTIKRRDKRIQVRNAAPTKNGTIAAGAAGTMAGGAALHAGFKAYNKGLNADKTHLNKYYDREILRDQRTSAGGTQPGKTGKTYEKLMNEERNVKLKKIDAGRALHGVPSPVKGLKLAGKVGLGALAIGGLTAAGSYGYNKYKQYQAAQKPI